MYVWYGTNEYNFETLENPPEFEPTFCSKYGTHIVLSEDAFTWSSDEYWCEECTAKEMRKRFA
jgi:hypothetical protein